MAKKAKVSLDLKHVMIKVKGATDKVLHQAALQMEAHAKVNIVSNNQVDTGFMLNSTYVEGPRGSTFGNTRPGDSKIKAPRHRPSGGKVAVVVGAVYAIYQEILNPFLRTAAQTVAGQFGGVARPVYKAHFND